MTGRESADRKQARAGRLRMLVAGPMLSIGVILACLPAFHGCLGLGKRSGAAPRKRADNSPCMTCHMDFKKEPLAVGHAAIGAGCATCHGESGAHGDDESNIITPDVMFGRAEIRPFCMTCHQTHTKGKVLDAFLAKWADKRRPNGRIVSEESVCTDCHGNHAVLRPDQLNPTDPG